MKRQHDYQLVMPFSDDFSQRWDIWKQYKWASHKFKYKSVFSEQAAIEQLVTLSGGDEEKAIKIINQSMRREWQGLFPLHETTTENGTGKSKKPTNEKNNGQSSYQDRVKSELADRLRKGQPPTGSDHLKAV